MRGFKRSGDLKTNVQFPNKVNGYPESLSWKFSSLFRARARTRNRNRCLCLAITTDRFDYDPGVPLR